MVRSLPATSECPTAVVPLESCDNKLLIIYNPIQYIKQLIFSLLLTLFICPPAFQTALHSLDSSTNIAIKLLNSWESKSCYSVALQFSLFIIAYKKNMKVIRIEGASIEKLRNEGEKETVSKKSLKVRHRMFGQTDSRKLQPHAYEVAVSAQQHRDPPEFLKSQAEMKLFIGNAFRSQTSAEGGNKTEVQHKAQNKSEVKLPFLGNRRQSILSKKQLPSKLDNSELVDIIMDNQHRQNRMTFLVLGKPGGKSLLKIEKGTVNGQKGNNLLKLMRIEAMRPTQKSPLKNAEFSMREIELNKIEKTCPIYQDTKNQTQTSLMRTEKKSEEKPKRQSENFTTTQTYLRKQRKAISIIKQSNNQKKKLTNSYLDFCLFISLTNKMEKPTEPFATYKAFVGKGNNSILIKSTLKNRFWWNVIDSDADTNLFWTQHRDNKFLQSLKSTNELSVFSNQNNKKCEFIIQHLKETEKGSLLKSHVRQGLNKLLSSGQQKQFGLTDFHVTLNSSTISGKFQKPNKMHMHNHLEFNWHLCNKKALYYNLRAYYQAMKENPYQYIPLTFHIQKENDDQWVRFEESFRAKESENAKKEGRKRRERNMWIIKPGENSNQGCGIAVSDSLVEIREMVKSRGVRPNGKQRSHIIQKYLMPFLYNKRKFDLRCYVLVTSVNAILKAYWYEEGYIRTSSKDFNTKNLKNRVIHLTNDSIQKRSQEYGKYENGNKVSFNDFQKYVESSCPGKQWDFYGDVYPKMMKLAADSVKSTYLLLDANKREYSFEILGLDFMIDEDFGTWLIEVNNNPCLELGSPLLARIIPNMLENAFKIALDPIYPPPKDYPKNKFMPTDLFESNKFTLIFNSDEEGENLKNLLQGVNLEGIVESDEEQEGIQNEEIAE